MLIDEQNFKKIHRRKRAKFVVKLQISLNFIMFFCSNVIKFLKSRVESGTIRGQQPELREMRVLIAVVFCRLEYLV